MGRDDKEEGNEDYDAVAGMANRLKLKGREREKYIHDHMTGLGYRMTPSYVRPDDDDDDEGQGGRFRFRGRGGRAGGQGGRDDDNYPF